MDQVLLWILPAVLLVIGCAVGLFFDGRFELVVATLLNLVVFVLVYAASCSIDPEAKIGLLSGSLDALLSVCALTAGQAIGILLYITKSKLKKLQPV